MNGIIEVLGLTGTIGCGIGLVVILLLTVIAARLSKVIDLLDELADLFTSDSQQERYESRKETENIPA